ncbi:hypothetical protein QTP70_018419 [Hemibagrus guttatus]|uniref:SET domain-containing protein n=1 Tax=Hemibagrus guttatus TaxID=175788 RepID=A0AAE0QXM7_9TELE|nr:hypothetical protein QTP70_018419 [Hemibagrus guttatus]
MTVTDMTGQSLHAAGPPSLCKYIAPDRITQVNFNKDDFCLEKQHPLSKMTEMKLRRGKASPKKEAADFTATGKDRDGFDVKYISSDKVYHDALKVFMFEFCFNGKLLCVDAAREDGSLGRLVNDDHINPNSNMKIITVKGKPHLCLIATRSINPGEEITYNHGDSEWPWRSKVLCYNTFLQTASEKHQLQPQEMSTTTSSEAVSKADPFTPTTAVTLEAIKQRQQNEAGTVPEVTTSPRVITDKSETVVPTEDTEKNEAGTVPEVTTSPTVITDKSETVVPTEDTEKIAVVKEQSGSEGQETIGPSEKTAKSALVLLLRSAQACHFSRLEILMPVLEVNLRMGVKVRIWRLAGVHHCRSGCGRIRHQKKTRLEQWSRAMLQQRLETLERGHEHHGLNVRRWL